MGVAPITGDARPSHSGVDEETLRRALEVRLQRVAGRARNVVRCAATQSAHPSPRRRARPSAAGAGTSLTRLSAWPDGVRVRERTNRAPGNAQNEGGGPHRFGGEPIPSLPRPGFPAPPGLRSRGGSGRLDPAIDTSAKTPGGRLPSASWARQAALPPIRTSTPMWCCPRAARVSRRRSQRCRPSRRAACSRTQR